MVMNECGARKHRRGGRIAGGGNIVSGSRASSREEPGQAHRTRQQTRAACLGALNRTTVLHGDAADEELLLEENIDSGTFRALTNSESEHPVAMLAKRLGATSDALINKRRTPSSSRAAPSTSPSRRRPYIARCSRTCARRRGRVHSLRRGRRSDRVIVHAMKQLQGVGRASRHHAAAGPPRAVVRART